MFTALLRGFFFWISDFTVSWELDLFDYAENNYEKSYGFWAVLKYNSHFLFLFKAVHFIMSSIYKNDA